MMPSRSVYDVVIIGAGPAGLFAALELTKNNGFRVLLVEKGKDLPERSHKCADDILCGWGGAGAYSDGKLNLSPHVGGILSNYMGEQELLDAIEYVDAEYVAYGASDRVYGGDSEEIDEFRKNAAKAELKLMVSRIRHIGTEVCIEVLARMRERLMSRIDTVFNTSVVRIDAEHGVVSGVELENGERIACRAIVAAPGREGSEWFAAESARLGLKLENNPVDIGVRVEVPAPVMQPLTDVLYESKFLYTSRTFDDPVRTFCMCPHGEVALEYNNGLVTVNGHSYAARKTDNTNFAVLASTVFTSPFNQPIAYGKYVASLANMISDGVIVQRLGDLRAGRRSTVERIARCAIDPTLKTATPGDLSFVLPYRYLCGVMEMLEAMDKVAPGVNSKETLLYGVEVKFYSSRVELSGTFETGLRNLFGAGDGVGITRGLVQASVSGMVAARAIIERLK